jgi:uncharacterized membrane protein
MKMNLTQSSLVAAVMGAVFTASIQPQIAFAASAIAKNVTTTSISTGFAKVFASSPQTYTNTGVIWSSSITNGASKDFWVNNATGSKAITAFSVTVTLPANANISFFKRCNLGVSFTGPNTCASGSPTTITMTSGTEFTLTLPMSNATFYQFRITQNKTGTITVATRVSSADIVSTTSNS